MLINEFRNNIVYAEERKKILDEISGEKPLKEDKLYDFSYCNFDEKAEKEIEKLLNYITNSEANKPAIGTGLIIETEDRARVDRLAEDIMKYMERAGIHTGRIYNFTEKSILLGQEQSFCAAQMCIGDIVIVDELMNGKEVEETIRHLLARKENVWEKISSAMKDSKALNIICTSRDIIEERFSAKGFADLKYAEDVFNYRVAFGDMAENEIKIEVKNKLEKAGLTAGWRFSDQLDEYIKAVYAKSDLKNQAFADSLYKQIIKEHYGRENSNILDEESLPVYDKLKTYEEAAAELNEMTGLRNIKAFVKELSFLYRSDRLRKNLSSLHMVFSGNAGTGKTSVAKKLAEIYYAMGIIKKNKLVEVGASDLIAEYVGQTALKTKKVCQSAYDGILFIDEAYSLNPKGSSSGMSFRQDCINTLIQEMENNRDRLIVIMAGYLREMEELMDSNPGLRSRIYKTIEFEDYTDEEMYEIFIGMCRENGCTLSVDAKEKTMKKIQSLRFEDGFGNGRSIRNMYMQAMQNYMSTENADNGIVLRPEHFVLDREMSDYDELKDELNNMTGLKKVKSFVKEIMDTNIYMLRKCKGDKNCVNMNNNMLLVGNAGTGKSTVAGIISKMLYHIGVTKSPHTESLNISELISGYVGDASKLLGKKVSKAMGGVLFIDELYLLNEMNRSIGAEVTGVLLDVLENRRGDITVIIAGYEDETNMFMSSNQGLKSRIPYVLKFDDYNVEELTEIFTELCLKNNLRVGNDAVTKFKKVISGEMEGDSFANGRSVRNIFDAALRKHAVNVIEGEISCEDEVLIADEIMPLNEMQTKIIGF